MHTSHVDPKKIAVRTSGGYLFSASATDVRILPGFIFKVIGCVGMTRTG